MGAITRDGPVTRGFDEFFGFHHARMMKSVFENDRVTQMIEPVDMLPALVKQHRTHRGAQPGGRALLSHLRLDEHPPVLFPSSLPLELEPFVARGKTCGLRHQNIHPPPA